MDDVMGNAVSENLDTLTDDQKAKWRELTGDPFQLKTACPPPLDLSGPREVRL
jgi:hypothetical protein